MKRGLIASLGALLAAVVFISLISAQSSYPLNDTFDADANGWTSLMHQVPDGTYVPYSNVTWMAQKDLVYLWPFIINHASGVIEVSTIGQNYLSNLPAIQKTVYLQPGSYQIRFRAGTAIYGENLKLGLFGTVTNSGTYWDWGLLQNAWTETTTAVFSVVSPGPITIKLTALDTFYLDYIRVEPYTSGSTPTPYTTMVVTPVPTEQQATPMPVPTQYCQPPAATPTGPASFDVTPTATPDTSGDWQFSDTFSGASLSSDWETSGAGATVNTSVSGPDNAAGVLVMPFASAPEIIYFHTITPTIYVDGWAMANALPIGSTASVHVSLWDGPSYGWVTAGSANFGPGQWYPFHIIVTDPGLHSLPSTAVSIYISGPDGDSAYLDNIYIYNSTRGAPFCGFSTAPVNQFDAIYVVYPANKPCPLETSGFGDVPNNFWGPLFFWMSIHFLEITAPFPLHDALSSAMAIEEFSSAPFWKYIQFGSMLLDFRPVFAMVGLLITLEIVRVFYSIWRLILKIIPMMG